MTEARGFIVTSSGRRVQLPDVRPEDVDLLDIAHACGHLCRFNGHVSVFYSVAAHMALCCELAERDHEPRSLIPRCALMHDAAEAYVGDFPSPLKAQVPEYREFEHRVSEGIYRALNLPPPDHHVWREVKKYDLQALYAEARALFSPPPVWIPHDVPYDNAAQIRTGQMGKVHYVRKLVEYGYLTVAKP